MRSRNITRRVAKAAVVGTATGLIATLPTIAHAAPRPQGSAYGLAADGLVNLAPMPAVASSKGEVGKSLLSQDNQVLRAGLLDVKARPNHAESKVARLAVPSAKLNAKAVDVKCHNGRGSTRLVDATIAGKRLQSAPPPNTTVPVDIEGVGRTALTLNKQERTRDGKLKVTGMELKLPGGKGTNVRAASATCGKAAKKPHGKKHGKKPAEAPKPSPVRNDLPVTG